MFIIVTFPWPVPSANVELVRRRPPTFDARPRPIALDFGPAQPELVGSGQTR